MRWASPPESVSADRTRERYSRPTLLRNVRRLEISFRIRSAMAIFCGASLTLSNQRNESLSDIADSSWMVRSPTLTLRASMRKRVPSHSGQVLVEIYFESSSRTAIESVSRWRRSRLGTMPSKVSSRKIGLPRSPGYLNAILVLPEPYKISCWVSGSS